MSRRLERHLGQIYATVMLVVMCINAFRYSVVFDATDTIGAQLIMKICLLGSFWLIAVLHAAYYVASHTGSLDRVFRQVTLCTADISPKYSHRAKAVTAICWTMVALDIILYTYPIVLYEKFPDFSMLVLFDSLQVSKPYADIVRAMFVVLDVQLTSSYVFPQAMNNVLFFFGVPGVVYSLSNFLINVHTRVVFEAIIWEFYGVICVSV